MKKFQLNDAERDQIIIAKSSIVYLIISAIVAMFSLFAAIFYFGNIISSDKFLLVLDKASIGDNFFIVNIILVILMGSASAFIRRFEAVSRGVMFKKSEAFKLNTYFLYLFFFIILAYPAFFLYLPAWKATTALPQSSLITAILIITVIATWILRNVWDTVFRIIIRFVTPLDWRLIMDKNHFSSMMNLKFGEVMRYQGPLSLLMIGIKDYDLIKTKFSRRAVKKVQQKIMDFMNAFLRNIDIVGRVESGQFIAALMNTAGMDARIPAQRILESMENLEFKVGKEGKMEIEFRIGIASYDQSMHDSQELVDKANLALTEALQSESEPIVYPR